MAFDYTEIANAAKEVVEEFGRQVSFIKHKKTLDDELKPWEGTTTPTVTPEATLTASAVFVPLSETAKFLGLNTINQDLIKRSDQVALVALGASETSDISEYDELLDGTVQWKIESVTALRPGDTTVLYFIGVKR